MPSNAITDFTRRDLFDHLRISGISWCGQKSESDFLERVFTISKLPSNDYRASTMEGDVHLHRENFSDWGGEDWIYDDGRLDLMGCPDETLLRFLAEMVHPLVRPDQEKVTEIVELVNGFLVRDGYQLEVASVISGKRIFAGVATIGQQAAGTDDAKRVADDMASDHVAGQVTRMKASIVSDPALAIGSAKEFVESIAKGILREQGVSITGNEPMPSLVQMVRKELNLTISPEMDETLKGTLTGLSRVTQGLAELRGKLGTGHGASPDVSRPPVEVARLVVGMATTLGVFLYEVHRNRRKPPEPPASPDLDDDIPF
jgi:hypothetical protein